MKEKYGYFLIWGNGLQYSKEIINQIRNDDNFEILKIKLHEVKDINKFVEQIYSVDYAPFEHLKGKTKYLLNSEPRIIIIFTTIKHHREKFFGEGNFRHIECEYVKEAKEKIRNQFNPRKNNERTHEHVIHASDSEYQVDYLLKLLNHKEGVKIFSKKPNSILSNPYHIRPFNEFTLKKIDINSLYCNIIKGDKKSFFLEKVELINTPHYKFIDGDPSHYKKYIDNFGGHLLTDDHDPENFKKLNENFVYLSDNNPLDYILVEEFQMNNFIIIDGVHRACLLKKQGHKEIIVAVIKN